MPDSTPTTLNWTNTFAPMSTLVAVAIGSIEWLAVDTGCGHVFLLHEPNRNGTPEIVAAARVRGREEDLQAN
jgi:hypothetical protein